MSGTYQYDGHYRRVKETVGDTTSYWVYALSGQLLHHDEVSAGRRWDYVYASGEAIVRLNVFAGGQRGARYPITDHQGSVVRRTDEQGGIRKVKTYTPYGEVWGPEAAANDNQRGFTGHIRDTASGLTYMQARYYDPECGCFLSPDPVGFAEGGADYFARYPYTNNNPINNIDPDGRACVPCAGFVIGFIGDIATQTLIEGKPLGEVNLVSAVGGGIVGATGLGALTKGSQAVKSVNRAKSVNKRLPKARREAQSRRSRGKDSSSADRNVDRLEQDVTKQVTDAVAAVGAAATAAAGKAATEGAFPEATVDNAIQAVEDVMDATGNAIDRGFENLRENIDSDNR